MNYSATFERCYFIPGMATPQIRIKRWQFGGNYPYDLEINGRRERLCETAQETFDYCALHYPGEPVTVDIRP